MMFEGLKQNSAVLGLQKQYEMLPPRDRQVLTIFGIILSIFIIYYAMWVPAHDYMKNAQRDVEQNEKLLALVKQNTVVLSSLAKGQSSAGTGKVLTSQQLVSSVTNMAKRSGVALKRFEPSGDKKIKVWVDNASFDKMMTWLASMKKTLNVTVEQISIEKDDTAGLVSARLTLSS